MYSKFILSTLLSTFIISLVYTQNSQAFETKAAYARIIDADTSAVLFETNSYVPMTPSSMIKLMTIYMVFEKLKNGSISLQDKFPISEKAWSKKGSKMFVNINENVTLEALLLGVIVQSGNDACIAIAEGLMGSEDAFTDAMNKKAKALGLINSQFKNSSRWPEAGHVMSASDLATLAKIITKQFPEYYNYFAIKEYVHNNIKQANRNILLNRNIGVNGLKTGHTEIPHAPQ